MGCPHQKYVFPYVLSFLQQLNYSKSYVNLDLTSLCRGEIVIQKKEILGHLEIETNPQPGNSLEFDFSRWVKRSSKAAKTL